MLVMNEACFQFVFVLHLKAWDTHGSIIVEGDLLTCTEDYQFYGARYRTAFSPDFPHLEVGGNLNYCQSNKGWIIRPQKLNITLIRNPQIIDSSFL